MEHAASVAKTFLTSDAVIVDIKELDPLPMRTRMPPVAPPPMPKSPSKSIYLIQIDTKMVNAYTNINAPLISRSLSDHGKL